MRTCERLVQCASFNPKQPVGLLAYSYCELLEQKKPILGEWTLLSVSPVSITINYTNNCHIFLASRHSLADCTRLSLSNCCSSHFFIRRLHRHLAIFQEEKKVLVTVHRERRLHLRISMKVILALCAQRSAAVLRIKKSIQFILRADAFFVNDLFASGKNADSIRSHGQQHLLFQLSGRRDETRSPIEIPWFRITLLLSTYGGLFRLYFLAFLSNCASTRQKQNLRQIISSKKFIF